MHFKWLAGRIKKVSNKEEARCEELLPKADEVHEHHNKVQFANWIFPQRSAKFQARWDRRKVCTQSQSTLVARLPREVREKIIEYVLKSEETLYIYLRVGNLNPIKEVLLALDPSKDEHPHRFRARWRKAAIQPTPSSLKTILLEAERGRPLTRLYDPTCMEYWPEGPLDHYADPAPRVVDQLRRPPGILLTCRWIYEEGIFTLYARHSFMLQYTINVMEMEPLWPVMRLMSPGASQLIQNLGFKWFIGPPESFCERCRAWHDDTWRVLQDMPRLRRLSIEFETWVTLAPWRWSRGFEHLHRNPCRTGSRQPQTLLWVLDNIAPLKQVEHFELSFDSQHHWIKPELESPKIEVFIRP